MKAFVRGTVWRISSCDQWGVELGQSLVLRTLLEWDAAAPPLAHHSPTNALIRHSRARRATRGQAP